MSEDDVMRMRVVITGVVQGVGYRYWTEDAARRHGLDGWVRNRFDGTVEALFQGEPAMVAAMLEACRTGPRFSRVAEVHTFESNQPVEAGFRILPSA